MLRGNRIFKITSDGKKSRVFFIPGLSIKFKGKNNEVCIGYPYGKFDRCKIKCGNDCKISIDSSVCRIKNLKIFADANNAVCHIGKNFHCTNGCEIIVRHEPDLKVIIGENCLFGKNIELRTSDAHSIYNCKTGEVLNFGKDIEIGSHCWFGHNVCVMKGAKVPNNSVVAMGSIVTKEFVDSNSIYAGVPAKLVKSDIDWKYEAPKKN